MSVLVTGAGGLIGRRLCARLQEEGEEVRALLLPDEDDRGIGGEVFRGDVTSQSSLAAACDGVERVVHLAAVVGDWGPDSLFRSVNVDGTRNVLEAAIASRVQNFVMVSSIVVYGWQLHTARCDEDLPRQRGYGPYGRTKRESEELAMSYNERGELPVTVVRPGNVYGPGSANWVDGMVDILRAGQGVLIDKGRGDAALVYIDNAVDVIVLAMRSERAAGRIYNAIDAGGVTWQQYMSDLAIIAGAKPPERSISWQVAMAAAIAMETVGRVTRRAKRPLLTREAVALLASRQPIPIERARRELGYDVPASYPEAMQCVADYVRTDLT